MAKRDPKAHVINETLDEAVNAILKGMDGIAGDLKKEMKKGFGELKVGQGHLQSQINDLKWDAPARKDFEELKRKVESYHPSPN